MSKPDKPTSEQGIKEFILKEMGRSGYSLQVKVAEKLKKYFETIQLEHPFLDKDEGKGRSYDINARAILPSLKNFKEEERKVLSALNLVIECKNITGNAWIFFPAETLPYDIPIYHSIYSYWQPDPFPKYLWNKPIPEMPWGSGFSEFIFDKDKSNKKDNNLFDAVNVVTKATSYTKDTGANLSTKLYFKNKIRLSRIIGLDVYLPVIVFSGKMYMASIEDAEMRLRSIKFVQLEYDYVSSNYNEAVTIHVVSYDALDQYVSLLKKYHFPRMEAMLKDQETLLSQTMELGNG